MEWSRQERIFDLNFLATTSLPRYANPDNREVLQYVITCQNTYVICRQALRQVLVLQHFAALWLDVKAENPGCGLAIILAPSSKQRKVCASHPRVPKSKR